MLLHISLSLCLLVVYIHSAATVNITITSSPKLGADTVLCLNESVTLTCHTDQSVANIAWLWSNQSEHGETITVMAELTEVMYTCIASDDGKYMGQASITITANGSAPIVTRENFRYYISRIEGSNLTLTTTTTSNLSISSGYPVWRVLHDQPLPPTAKVINYTIDGVIYSNLSLYDLSYNDDTGNYTCTASNECGTSSVFTFIEVTKAPIMCNNSGSVAISLHDVTIIVQGDFVQISCIFKGNLDVLGASLTSYWSVNPPPAQHSDVSYVTDNTTNPYRIAVYQTCLTSGGSCCNFTNQLTILNIPSSLNDYKLSCVESLNTAGSEPTVHTNTTSIIVLMIPILLRGPINLNDDQSKIMLWCQFNASTIPGVTVVVWKRNFIQLLNSSLYQITQDSSLTVEDQVISTLTINSSNDYYGIYTCYCYYNSSLVTSSKPITSNGHSLTLQRKSSGGNKHRISKIGVVGIGAGSVTIIALIITALIFFFIVRSKCKHGSATLHQELNPGDQSTKPLLSPVNGIEVLRPEEEVGPKPCLKSCSTPAYGSTLVFEDGNRDCTSSPRSFEYAVQDQEITPTSTVSTKQSSYDTVSDSKPWPKQHHTHDSEQSKKHGTCTVIIHPNTSESLHPQPGPDVEPFTSVLSGDHSNASELEASKPDEDVKNEPSANKQEGPKTLKPTDSAAASVESFPSSKPVVSHTSRQAAKADVSNEPPQIDMIILLLLLQTETTKFPPSENDGWLEYVSELLKKIEHFVQLNDTELKDINDPKLEPSHRPICLYKVIKERKKINEVSKLLYGIYYGNRVGQLQAAAYESNNEIMSSAVQQGSVQPQETHHHHNITYNLQINYHVTTDSALHRAEELLLDTDNFANPLSQHATDFMCMVNITILPPVLFENDLLTSHDMEFLQLLTITDGEKIKFLYITLLRRGEEGYKKFMECLQNPYAKQHDGHKELYEKLLKS